MGINGQLEVKAAAHSKVVILVCGSTSAMSLPPSAPSVLSPRLCQHRNLRALMGVIRLVGSEDGGALQSGNHGLRQHGDERLAALHADVVGAETASREINAC